MSGSSVALDTSAAIAVLSGQASDLLARSIEQLLLPVPVVGELRYGALNSRRVAENLTSVERLVTNCQVLNITTETAVVYANLRLSLKEEGKPIPENDLWTAALCIEYGVPLATLDAHFDVVGTLSRAGV